MMLALTCCCTGVWGQSWLQRAQIQSDSGDYRASNATLYSFIQQHPERLFDVSRAYFLISYNQMRAGNYDESLRTNDLSRQLREQLQTGEEEENLMRSGAIYLAKGDYERALDYLYQAKQLPIDDAFIIALIDGYMGSTYLELGQWAKAEHHFLQTLETLRVEAGEESADMAVNYYNLGRVYWLSGQNFKARDQWEQALTIAQNIGMADLEGQLLNALGEWRRREAPTEAAPFYEKAYQVLSNRPELKGAEIARVRANQARLSLSLDSLALAQVYLQDALRLLCPEGCMPNPVNAYTSDKILLADVLQLFAQYYLLSFDQAAEPDSGLLVQALQYAENSVMVAEDQLSTLSGDASRYRMLNNAQPCFAVGVEAAMRLYELSEYAPHAQKALNLAERGKGFVLRANALALNAAESQHPALAARERSLRHELRAWEAQLASQPENALWRSEMAKSRQSLLSFVDSVKDAAPDFYRLRWNTGTPELTELQSKLDETSALLSYFVGNGYYYLFAITRDQLAAHRLPGDYAGFKKTKTLKWIGMLAAPKPDPLDTGQGTYSKFNLNRELPNLQEAVNGYLGAIKKVETNDFIFFANNLYYKLIFPALKTLKGKSKLWVIPHDILCRMPFEAILTAPPTDEGEVKYHKLDYLVNKYAVSYHYTAEAALMNTSAIGPQASQFLGMAPVFNEGSAEGYVWNSHLYLFDSTYQTQTALRDAVDAGGRHFKVLPYSEAEITSIARRFADKKQSGLAYVGPRATEAEYRRQAAGFRYLHLATHSFVNETDPALSGIAFAQPGKVENASDDGVLYASEVLTIPLHGQTVVLSSCESGAGTLAPGEGLLSLTRAFLEAGAGQVVGSCWKVQDRQTSQLMDVFYSQLLDGKSHAEALQQAKIKLIKDKNIALPKYWCAFILFGR